MLAFSAHTGKGDYPKVTVAKEKGSDARNEAPKGTVGLCANCRFMRRIESDRGSTFYLCARSATDTAFPKYPRLPVLQCAGYEPMSPDGDRN
ncbi:MAG: hypothetical protein ABSG72_20925 [Candidatus Sulfotelmatobacter sp.]